MHRSNPNHRHTNIVFHDKCMCLLGLGTLFGGNVFCSTIHNFVLLQYGPTEPEEVELQAHILFELAAFVSGACPGSLQVSKQYMDLAAQWATELEEELAQQARSGHGTRALVEQSELKAKIAMCHYLVIVACGCSGDNETGQMRSVESFAQQLCQHMLLVCPEHLSFELQTGIWQNNISMFKWYVGVQAVSSKRFRPSSAAHDGHQASGRESYGRNRPAAMQHSARHPPSPNPGVQEHLYTCSSFHRMDPVYR